MRIISSMTDQTIISKILRHIAFRHADAPQELARIAHCA
jgi:hypothetical protein